MKGNLDFIRLQIRDKLFFHTLTISSKLPSYIESLTPEKLMSKNNLCQVKKKTKHHNLKVENYVLFGNLIEDYSPENQPSVALRDCYKEGREEPGYMGILDGKKAVVK